MHCQHNVVFYISERQIGPCALYLDISKQQIGPCALYLDISEQQIGPCITLQKRHHSRRRATGMGRFAELQTV